MKLVISPAKSLEFSKPLPTEDFSVPHFIKESKKINKNLKELTPKEIGEMMSISEKLAELNWQRNQERTYKLETVSENVRQAIFAFNGDVYTSLDAYSISKEKYDILNEKVRILSGLYGILKPFDLIEPYRLEMGKKLEVGETTNLYQIWKPLITDFLNKEMEKDEVLVNLASTEYFNAVDTKKLKSRLITPEFKELKDDKLKIVSFFAKKARGLMARFIIEENIQNVEDLKMFNIEGYSFSEENSTENKLIFTR